MTALIGVAALAALLTAPALAAAPGSAAPAAAARTTVVELGGARAYVHGDEGASLAGVELFVRAGADRQAPGEGGLATLVAESVLQTPVGSAAAQALPLADAVDACGASLTYAVATQHVRFFLEGTPAGLAAAAPLVARALAAPAFDAATLAVARAALAERAADQQGDPRLVGLAMLRSGYYRGGAALQPPGGAGALAALTPAAAQAYFARWYLRGDALVAAVGRTGAATDAAGRAIVAALPAGTAAATVLRTRPFAAQPRRMVTQRDIGAPYVLLGFAAPSLGDRDFAAALVIRALLANVIDRPTATSQPAVFRLAGTIYEYDAAPAQLVLWINGGRLDPETGLSAVATIVKRAAAKPLTAAVLDRSKETARGEWTLRTVVLEERAFAIGNAAAHGLDADAADAVGAAIARVSAADVQRAAKKYFQRFDVALVMPRGARGG